MARSPIVWHLCVCVFCMQYATSSDALRPMPVCHGRPRTKHPAPAASISSMAARSGAKRNTLLHGCTTVRGMRLTTGILTLCKHGAGPTSDCKPACADSNDSRRRRRLSTARLAASSCRRMSWRCSRSSRTCGRATPSCVYAAWACYVVHAMWDPVRALLYVACYTAHVAMSRGINTANVANATWYQHGKCIYLTRCGMYATAQVACCV
jgi:hypothetical protein